MVHNADNEYESSQLLKPFFRYMFLDGVISKHHTGSNSSAAMAEFMTYLLDCETVPDKSSRDLPTFRFVNAGQGSSVSQSATVFDDILQEVNRGVKIAREVRRANSVKDPTTHWNLAGIGHDVEEMMLSEPFFLQSGWKGHTVAVRVDIPNRSVVVFNGGDGVENHVNGVVVTSDEVRSHEGSAETFVEIFNVAMRLVFHSDVVNAEEDPSDDDQKEEPRRLSKGEVVCRLIQNELGKEPLYPNAGMFYEELLEVQSDKETDERTFEQTKRLPKTFVSNREPTQNYPSALDRSNFEFKSHGGRLELMATGQTTGTCTFHSFLYYVVWKMMNAGISENDVSSWYDKKRRQILTKILVDPSYNTVKRTYHAENERLMRILLCRIYKGMLDPEIPKTVMASPLVTRPYDSIFDDTAFHELAERKQAQGEGNPNLEFPDAEIETTKTPNQISSHVVQLQKTIRELDEKFQKHENIFSLIDLSYVAYRKLYSIVLSFESEETNFVVTSILERIAIQLHQRTKKYDEEQQRESSKSEKKGGTKLFSEEAAEVGEKLLLMQQVVWLTLHPDLIRDRRDNHAFIYGPRRKVSSYLLAVFFWINDNKVSEESKLRALSNHDIFQLAEKFTEKFDEEEHQDTQEKDLVYRAMFKVNECNHLNSSEFFGRIYPYILIFSPKIWTSEKGVSAVMCNELIKKLLGTAEEIDITKKHNAFPKNSFAWKLLSFIGSFLMEGLEILEDSHTGSLSEVHQRELPKDQFKLKSSSSKGKKGSSSSSKEKDNSSQEFSTRRTLSLSFEAPYVGSWVVKCDLNAGGEWFGWVNKDTRGFRFNFENLYVEPFIELSSKIKSGTLLNKVLTEFRSGLKSENRNLNLPSTLVDGNIVFVSPMDAESEKDGTVTSCSASVQHDETNLFESETFVNVSPTGVYQRGGETRFVVLRQLFRISFLSISGEPLKQLRQLNNTNMTLFLDAVLWYCDGEIKVSSEEKSNKGLPLVWMTILQEEVRRRLQISDQESSGTEGIIGRIRTGEMLFDRSRPDDVDAIEYHIMLLIFRVWFEPMASFNLSSFDLIRRLKNLLFLSETRLYDDPKFLSMRPGLMRRVHRSLGIYIYLLSSFTGLPPSKFVLGTLSSVLTATDKKPIIDRFRETLEKELQRRDEHAQESLRPSWLLAEWDPNPEVGEDILRNSIPVGPGVENFQLLNMKSIQSKNVHQTHVFTISRSVKFSEASPSRPDEKYVLATSIKPETNSADGTSEELVSFLTYAHNCLKRVVGVPVELWRSLEDPHSLELLVFLDKDNELGFKVLPTRDPVCSYRGTKYRVVHPKQLPWAMSRWCYGFEKCFSVCLQDVRTDQFFALLVTGASYKRVNQTLMNEDSSSPDVYEDPYLQKILLLEIHSLGLTVRARSDEDFEVFCVQLVASNKSQCLDVVRGEILRLLGIVNDNMLDEKGDNGITGSYLWRVFTQIPSDYIFQHGHPLIYELAHRWSFWVDNAHYDVKGFGENEGNEWTRRKRYYDLLKPSWKSLGSWASGAVNGFKDLLEGSDSLKKMKDIVEAETTPVQEEMRKLDELIEFCQRRLGEDRLTCSSLWADRFGSIMDVLVDGDPILSYRATLNARVLTAAKALRRRLSNESETFQNLTKKHVLKTIFDPSISLERDLITVMFETLTETFARDEQLRLVEAMLRSLPPSVADPQIFHPRLHQAVMGIGKTSVVLVLLLLRLLQSHNNTQTKTVWVVQPSHLVNSTAKRLTFVVNGLYWNRGYETGTETLGESPVEVRKFLRHRLSEDSDVRYLFERNRLVPFGEQSWWMFPTQVLVTSDVAVKSFQLQALRQMEVWRRVEGSLFQDALDVFLRSVRTTTCMIMDEVDSLMNALQSKFNVVVPDTDPNHPMTTADVEPQLKSVDPATGQFLLHKTGDVRHRFQPLDVVVADDGSVARVVVSRDQGSKAAFALETVDEVPPKRLVESSREIFFRDTNFKTNYFKFMAEIAHDIVARVEFDEETLRGRLLNARLAYNPEFVNKIVETVDVVSNMSFKMEFGPDSDPQNPLTVPYSALNTPISGSRFSDIDVSVLVTFVTLYHVKLRPVDLNEMIFKAGQLFRLHPELPAIFFRDIKVEIEGSAGSGGVELLKDKESTDFDRSFCENPKVLAFYATKILSEKIKYTPEVFNLSFVDIFVDEFCWRRTGMSGTDMLFLPDGPERLKFQYHNNDPDAPMVPDPDGNEKIDRVFRERGGAYAVIPEVPTLPGLINVLQPYDAVIDAAAVFKEFTSEEVIQMFRRKHRLTNTEYSRYVFVDEKAEVKQINRNGELSCFANGVSETEKTFYFYSQQFTVGVDIEQPVELKGAVIVHERLRKDEVAQAMFRMRNVDEGHTVDFVLADKIGKGEDRKDRETSPTSGAAMTKTRASIVEKFTENYTSGKQSLRPLFDLQNLRTLLRRASLTLGERRGEPSNLIFNAYYGPVDGSYQSFLERTFRPFDRRSLVCNEEILSYNRVREKVVAAQASLGPTVGPDLGREHEQEQEQENEKETETCEEEGKKSCKDIVRDFIFAQQNWTNQTKTDHNHYGYKLQAWAHKLPTSNSFSKGLKMSLSVGAMSYLYPKANATYRKRERNVYIYLMKSDDDDDDDDVEEKSEAVKIINHDELITLMDALSSSTTSGDNGWLGSSAGVVVLNRDGKVMLPSNAEIDVNAHIGVLVAMFVTGGILSLGQQTKILHRLLKGSLDFDSLKILYQCLRHSLNLKESRNVLVRMMNDTGVHLEHLDIQLVLADHATFERVFLDGMSVPFEVQQCMVTQIYESVPDLRTTDGSGSGAVKKYRAPFDAIEWNRGSGSVGSVQKQVEPVEEELSDNGSEDERKEISGSGNVEGGESGNVSGSKRKVKTDYVDLVTSSDDDEVNDVVDSPVQSKKRKIESDSSDSNSNSNNDGNSDGDSDAVMEEDDEDEGDAPVLPSARGPLRRREVEVERENSIPLMMNRLSFLALRTYFRSIRFAFLGEVTLTCCSSSEDLLPHTNSLEILLSLRHGAISYNEPWVVSIKVVEYPSSSSYSLLVIRKMVVASKKPQSNVALLLNLNKSKETSLNDYVSKILKKLYGSTAKSNSLKLYSFPEKPRESNITEKWIPLFLTMACSRDGTVAFLRHATGVGARELTPQAESLYAKVTGLSRSVLNRHRRNKGKEPIRKKKTNADKLNFL